MKKLNCILLIDDDNDDNFFHQRVIKKINAAENVEVVKDGIEALDYLKKENRIPPELIFLDLNMPRMNGWEFLEEYKKLPESKKAKKLFILSTSNFSEDVKKTETIVDVAGYKVKPLTAETLNEILEKYF